MENVATYSEARSEYTKQLATFIVPSMVGWFQTLWSRNATDKQRCLSLFQTECEEVARWNQDRINDEVRVLLEKSGCDYMEELMTAVFIAHTKVLTAVRLSTKQKKLSITVPKLDHFVHRIFREAARGFWKTPFLFMTDHGVMERQKNLLQIEALASEAITTAVRGLLPVKQILQDYLGEDEVDEAVPGPETPDVILASALEATPAPAPAPAASPEKHKVAESKEEEEDEDVGEKPKAPKVDVVDLDEKPKVLKSAMKESEPVVAAAAPPSEVNIQTEPAVTFSSYDDVFDEAKGAPELRFSPKDGDGDEEDVESLSVNESSAAPLTVDDDVEDLDAPVAVQKVPAPAAKKETIDDIDVEVLE